MNTKQIIHELALIHAQAKYKEFFNAVPPASRPFQSDINELINFYEAAVTILSNHVEEIENAYKDSDGNCLFED